MAINEWIIGPTFSQTRRERKLNFMLELSDDDRRALFDFDKLSYHHDDQRRHRSNSLIEFS